MKKANLQIFAVLSIAVCITVFSIIGCRQKTEIPKGPAEKVTLAYSTLPNSVLVQIALINGYFTDAGLDLTLQPHAFGKVALKSVLDGQSDIATVAETPIMFAVMGGKPIYALAVIQTSNRNEAIIANTDRGIRKPADLLGRSVGITLGTNGDYFADTFFIANGIDRKLVRIVDMKPEEMQEALIAGKVDAVSTWNPHLQVMLKALGGKGLIFYGETLYTETYCLTAQKDFVKAHPEAIKKVLSALIRAEAFVKQNPEESRRLVAEFIKVDKVLLDEIWDVFDFSVTLNQSLIVTLEDQTRWAIKNRLSDNTNMPNYLDYVYLDGLAAVKPEAVRIIK